MVNTNAVKQRIREMGCTTDEIAEQVGISRPFLSYIINNHPNYTTKLDVVEKIGKVLKFNSFDEYLVMEQSAEPNQEPVAG